jgi:hypothetical protein
MIKSFLQNMLSLCALSCVLVVFLGDALVIFGGILHRYAPENTILSNIIGLIFLSYLFICPYHIVYHSRLIVLAPFLLIPLLGFFVDMWYVPLLVYGSLAIYGTVYVAVDRYD